MNSKGEKVMRLASFDLPLPRSSTGVVLPIRGARNQHLGLLLGRFPMAKGSNMADITVHMLVLDS